jgi:hypothetical protein
MVLAACYAANPHILLAGKGFYTTYEYIDLYLLEFIVIILKKTK